MNASQLNDAYSALADRLDAIPTDRAESGPINAAVSDWQDFYWAHLDQWPVNDLATWSEELPLLQQSMVALEKKYAGHAAPSEPSGSIFTKLPGIKVLGTWPLWMRVTAGGLLSLAMYKVARETKLL